jgi:putative flavoprotein involved in K+ transport
VLVVGAGNSGAEIAFELARAGHTTWLAGPDVGQIPWRGNGVLARWLMQHLLFRVVFHRVLTERTPVGRRVRAKGHSTTPLIRVRSRELASVSVTRTSRVTDVRDGKPVADDGRAFDVQNVIWCTGYEPGFSWIDLPVFDDRGEPRHIRGMSTDVPGLYFVGLHFLYAMSSAMLHGVGRDAEHVAGLVAASRETSRATRVSSVARTRALRPATN